MVRLLLLMFNLNCCQFDLCKFLEEFILHSPLDTCGIKMFDFPICKSDLRENIFSNMMTLTSKIQSLRSPVIHKFESNFIDNHETFLFHPSFHFLRHFIGKSFYGNAQLVFANEPCETENSTQKMSFSISSFCYSLKPEV